MDNKTKLQETIGSIFEGVDLLVDTKKVIGEPYFVGDTTIIPFIETSVGLGVGDVKENREVAGSGCKVKPVACLIIQNGFTKLINIDHQDYICKALDMLPDLIDKLINKGKNTAVVTETIEKVKEDYQN